MMMLSNVEGTLLNALPNEVTNLVISHVHEMFKWEFREDAEERRVGLERERALENVRSR